jgi:hypothetical protein
VVITLRLEWILKQLFRIHFPDKRLIDDLDDWLGQLSLGMHGRRMNRVDWNLARNIFNQSKIR